MKRRMTITSKKTSGNIKLSPGQTLSKATNKFARKQRVKQNKDMYPYMVDTSTPSSRDIETKLENGKLYTLKKNVFDETADYYNDKETLFHYVAVSKSPHNVHNLPKGMTAIYLGMRDVRELSPRSNVVFSVKRHSFMIGDRIYLVRDLGMFCEEEIEDVDITDD